ncbi:MAG: hypothetical protein ACQR33_04420 [Candidatus Saccharibacteria bacterium]
MLTAGSNVLELLDHIKAEGMVVDHRVVKQASVYSFGDSRYTVEVTIEFPKWLGLNFILHDSKIEYSIDTDVYNLADPANQTFVEEIEAEIVEFLHNLTDNRIKITHRKNRASLLIPRKAGDILIKQGRFMVSQTTLKSSADIVDKDSFSTFTFKE